METKQIEYIIKIADEGSITRAASRLFISQSALSQQLQKLEAELGAPLFRRNKSDWTLTPEGQIYLDNARDILRIKQRTYAQIADMAERKSGYLSVGMPPGRGTDMFSFVYPRFHELYPEMTVEPRELSVRAQQEQIRRGELDLGFVTLMESQKTIDEYITLFREEIMLALPEKYPVPEKYLHTDDPFPTLPLTELRYEPFVLVHKESTIRQMLDQIFQTAGFTPTILFETSSNQTILATIRARLACGMMPFHYAKQKPEGVRFYRLPFRPSWEVCASYRKDSCLSKAAKDFIRLANEYWT